MTKRSFGEQTAARSAGGATAPSDGAASPRRDRPSPARKLLRRIHIWLAWVVGIPLLLWTVSGLWMVLRPIEEVRGTTLRSAPAALILPATITPPPGAKALTLEMQGDRAVWIVDGARRADIATGAFLPPPTRAESIALARNALSARSRVVAVSRTPADAPPLDLRHARPAWGVTFAGDVCVYVDAETGGILAVRTNQWRWFDFMWGLHIMDLQTREDTSHATLIAFAATSAISILLALILLPITVRRKRRAR